MLTLQYETSKLPPLKRQGEGDSLGVVRHINTAVSLWRPAWSLMAHEAPRARRGRGRWISVDGNPCLARCRNRAVEARSADVVGDRFQAAEAGGIRAVDAGECQFGEAYASCRIVSLV